jgi:hypothetical protein
MQKRTDEIGRIDGISMTEHELQSLNKKAEFVIKTTLKIYEDVEKLLLHAISIESVKNRPDLLALFLLQLARLSHFIATSIEDRTRLDEAQDYAVKALSVYRQVGDTRGEAACTKEIEDIARMKSQNTSDGRAGKKRSGSTRPSRSRIRPAKRM